MCVYNVETCYCFSVCFCVLFFVCVFSSLVPYPIYLIRVILTTTTTTTSIVVVVVVVAFVAHAVHANYFVIELTNDLNFRFN